MKIRNLLRALAAGTFAAALSVAALGQSNPPPWWGVDDGNTTSQCWTFDNPNDPFAPDFVMNPWGSPIVGGSGSIQVEGSALDRVGVVVLRSGGQISFDIANDPRPDWIKQCWMQFTWALDGSATVNIDGAGSAMENVVQVDDPIPGTPWTTTTITFDLVPQPPFEIITFTAGENSVFFLDDFYFGTHCVVPEPATMAALGLGGLALIRRRRK